MSSQWLANICRNTRFKKFCLLKSMRTSQPYKIILVESGNQCWKWNSSWREYDSPTNNFKQNHNGDNTSRKLQYYTLIFNFKLKMLPVECPVSNNSQRFLKKSYLHYGFLKSYLLGYHIHVTMALSTWLFDSYHFGTCHFGAYHTSKKFIER